MNKSEIISEIVKFAISEIEKIIPLDTIEKVVYNEYNQALYLSPKGENSALQTRVVYISVPR